MEFPPDEMGNSFSVDGLGIVFLKLASEDRVRNIGQVFSGTYAKKVKKGNLFLAKDAFGFSYDVLEYLQPKFIVAFYEGEQYKISWEKYQEVKTFLYFKGAGYEKQIFIPRKYFMVGSDYQEKAPA